MNRSTKTNRNSTAALDVFACIAELAYPIEPNRFEELRSVLSGADGDIFDRARREGMAGFLYRALASSDLAGLFQEDRLRVVEKAYFFAVRKNLTLEHEFQRIIKNTKRHGVDIIVLQGMALIHTLYTDIGLRPMTDIDLWVREADSKLFFDILTSMGYTQDALYPGTFRNGIATLDIHHHLFWADRIRSRQRLLAVDQELIFQDTAPLSRGCPGALVLNTYDQVLYLGLHALKHNVDRLIWLVDIKLILARFDAKDWRKLVERAELLGMAGPLACVLYLLPRLLKFNLPAEIAGFRTHHAPGSGAKWLLRKRTHLGAMPQWSSMILFSSGMGPWEKLPFVWENLFPRPSVLRQVFPESTWGPAWPLYLKRVAQIAGIRR